MMFFPIMVSWLETDGKTFCGIALYPLLIFACAYLLLRGRGV